MKKSSILLKLNVIFICLLVLGSANAQNAPQQSFTALTQLTDDDYAWIGANIYQNEASSKPKYLTHWGKGEAFPSFGIAHFIWFPKNITPPFKETFPALFEFLSQKKSPPPIWLQKHWKKSQLQNNQTFSAPWSTKAEFDAAHSSAEMVALRTWLLNTQAQQARFVVLGFQQRWATETATLSAERLAYLNQRLQGMMTFKQGLFATVDYFNFKGLGNNTKEQYQGKSWGLFSVLEGMPSDVFDQQSTDQQRLQAFINAAKATLQQRVNLAPVERNESRWIPGWFKRLEGYRRQ